jgi:hypothetical protein
MPRQYEILIRQEKNKYEAKVVDYSNPQTQYGTAIITLGSYESFVPHMGNPIEVTELFLPWNLTDDEIPKSILYLDIFEIALDPVDRELGKNCGRRMLCGLLNEIKRSMPNEDVDSFFIILEAVPLHRYGENRQSIRAASQTCIDKKDAKYFPSELKAKMASKYPLKLREMTEFRESMAERGDVITDAEFAKSIARTLCHFRKMESLVRYYKTYNFKLAIAEINDTSTLMFGRFRKVLQSCRESVDKCRIPLLILPPVTKSLKARRGKSRTKRTTKKTTQVRISNSASSSSSSSSSSGKKTKVPVARRSKRPSRKSSH